jgi:hypothetical protein
MHACHSDQHVPVRALAVTLAQRALIRTVAVTLAVTLGAAGCGEDFHLSTSALQIAPNPAVPGDLVGAVFVLRLIPAQRHTIIVVVDETEHLRVTRDDSPEVPVVVDLGDAADLIATYGTGAHTAYIEVRALEANEKTRTRSASFQLNPAASRDGP